MGSSRLYLFLQISQRNLYKKEMISEMKSEVMRCYEIEEFTWINDSVHVEMRKGEY